METRWALVLLLTLKESDHHDLQMGGGAANGYFIYFNGLRTSGEMSGSSGAEQSADFHFKRPV